MPTDSRFFGDRRSYLKGTADMIPRGDYSGGLVTSDGGLGKYGEAALKGHLFSGVSTTNTIAAGNLNAATAAATTNTGLYNPTTSNTAVVLQRVTCGIQSGTLAAGAIYHSVSLDTTILTSITGFTRGLVCNNYASQTANAFILDSDAGVALTGSTALITLSAWGVGTTAAVVTTGLLPQIVSEVDGHIVLGPGDMYLPTFTAAGTSIVANFSYLWAEVPLTSI